jgi:serine phosphatase RsbU (regulator of sigma subunit)
MKCISIPTDTFDLMSTESLLPEILQQRLGGSMKLVETTCRLAAHHELDLVLGTVTESVCEALGCERASLYLYDKKRDELYTRVVTELEIEEIRTSLDTGITGWVARRRKIANIPDPAVDARWNSAIDRRTGYRTKNILAAPLISSHNDRLVGVLQLLNKTEGDFDEFDESLILAFGTHAANALERAQLLEETRQKKELEVAIDMGRQIQTSFLPEKLPEIAGYELAAWWQPADAVSGDYYDVLPFSDGRIGLVVADVSGHGVGPSLLMASVRAMLRVLTRTLSDPAKILSLLGETISPDLNGGRFITVLIAALEPHSHEVTFANAGHGPALHYRRQSVEFQPLASTTFPLGFTEDFSNPRSESLKMEPGDILVLGTDGAIELKGADGDMFGRRRLEQVVAANCDKRVSEVVDIARDTINAFHPHAVPPDDCTLMLLSRKYE